MTANALTAHAANDILFNPDQFAHGQRVARMFCDSQLIPQHLRGKIADVTIALLMAKRLGEDPLVVMQSIYIVSGKAGWSAQYMIARANRSGVFRGRINWRVKGEKENLVVTAFGILADTGEEVSIDVSMAMARAEGWTSNKKYQSMPEVMLRYRSATLLIRMYAPDVMLGYSTVEEIETEPVEPERVEVVQPNGAPAPRALTLQDAFSPVLDATAETVAVEAEPVHDEPAPEAPPEQPAAKPATGTSGSLVTEVKALEAKLAAQNADLVGALQSECGISKPLGANNTAALNQYRAALKSELGE